MFSLSLLLGSRFSRAKKRNKLVSFISLSSTIGIAVGVAVVLIGLSAMNGFERELENRVLSVIAHGEFEGARGPIKNWERVVTDAEKSDKVIAAAPYVKLTGLAEKGATLKAVEIRGVDAELEKRVSNLAEFIDQDAWEEFQPGNNQVILGKGIADHLGVKLGEGITLLIPQANNSLKVRAPKRVRLNVIGFLSLGGQIDHGLVLLPLADAQTYANIDESVTGVSIKTTNVFDAQPIVREVGDTLSVSVFLRSWQHKFGFLYRDIQLVRTIMYLVMVLVIGVACFNIVSTLMMAVKDRLSEIAILKTMGASDGLIRRTFIWQGVFSGVTGSLAGSMLGLFVASNLTTLIKGLESLVDHQFLSGDIYFIDFLPSEIIWQDVVIVSGTAVFLSLLATLYPASRASKIHPASVLSGK
ncbi:Lipoprotein-releasing system transmembrane protein lolE [Vibrio nigripulchritudo MADA3029]|uniref:lipoprotein-releasing ABC transporter permease subunit LolE n=1 Tax=Vibrio nigripulchritudo TaxID=28173 RepID=UPI0003B1D844|nr:lipoprotein-releasing ABC transporter permease subunit LolE [Vibrio nigripulchritudo]CCN49335.1 Lipoprotein-releasing system transmembrane protein lolE [Vibrio nigripulchritudo MADA3020]CCN51614.1 Lipoprotein-releasing system transmembrane protein lolE [Vibrio nigripulchritudo MADA3021]CCN57332.1 Lipoprotein-releasing system transmembrane protein lolE [Vibrio nigripulchritudo MADA3029]